MKDETEVGKIILCCVLVAAGLLLHFVTKLKELEDKGRIVTPWRYIADHPYTALMAVLGAYGALLLAYYSGELGPLGSFCMGYAANSAGDKARAAAERRQKDKDSILPP